MIFINIYPFPKGKLNTMTRKSVLALIVSSPGALESGLLALMTTVPRISVILVAEDFKSTLRMVENHQPALVLIDMPSLEIKDVIHEIKDKWPHIHLIVLADEVSQGEEACTLGVDSVLIKGFSAQKLLTVVEKALDDMEDTFPAQTNTAE